MPTTDSHRRVARGHRVLPALALAFIAGGAVASAIPRAAAWASTIWMAGLVAGGAPIVLRAARDAIAGRFATDLVATLAILTAIPLGEPLAGLIVVLMQSGGEALERYAEGRASAAVRDLERDAPRLGHRIVNGGTEDVHVDEIRIGDQLLIRPGEMLPCDGEVVEGRSHVDTGRLTGEPLPVTAVAGTRLMSGSVNGEGALTVRATARAGESQYARIVELVRSAQLSKAPLQRLADRYAVWFTPLTLLVCVIAWMWSGDPIRVLAVLVVATPCPLILAAPVAIIGGVNRAARRQIIVRTGGALERLANARVVALDKTGTLTVGMPTVSRVVAGDGFAPEEVLRLAAGVEERSGHLMARTLVAEARRRDVPIPDADAVVEHAGRGVVGRVDGRDVIVGSRSLLEDLGVATGSDDPEAEPAPGLRALVAVDGALAGTVEYSDALRPAIGGMLDRLRALGVRRIVLLSGDATAHARAVADAVGIEEVVADLLPEGKVRVIRELLAADDVVVMVGDGTNDAPALSAATVGIALAGHGGGIAAEAADVVLLIDDPSRVADAIAVGRRTLRIARQSILVGLGLSGVAMMFAAAGYIAPVAGALLQEGIDVAVILNALRASGSGRQPARDGRGTARTGLRAARAARLTTP